MIPNANNINNYNNQIKIQLTNDNKCIIETLNESPIKSKNTIMKDDYSINEDMSLSKSNSILNNNILNQAISNSNKRHNNKKNDLENNSNLLISFSNISEVTKMNNNDASITRINSYKNNSILMNKEKDFVSNINNTPGGNSFLLNQMQIMTGDKNVTINNINNYNITNSDGNSIISNNNFFISNEKNNKIKFNDNNFKDENTDTIKTPYKTNSRNSKNGTSNKKVLNNIDSKSSKKQINNYFNKNELSEISCSIINLNIDDKSENYDKVNMFYSDKKSFNTSNNLNSTTSKKKISSNNISPSPINKNSSNNKFNNIKYFKNCIVQKNEDINIIQMNSQNNKQIECKNNKNLENNNNLNNINNKIVPKHCANFYFIGTQKNNLKEMTLNNNKNIDKINLDYIQKDYAKNNNNTNTLYKNDDYVSPTFNLKLNYNSLDKNSNINTLESANEKEINKENFQKKENLNKSNKKINNNSNINNNLDLNNLKQKERKKNGPHENSNGSSIEITEKNKKEISKKNTNNFNDNNLPNNSNTNKNNKIQENSLSIGINSNLISKTNTNTKLIKENDLSILNAQNLNSKKNSGNSSNNNQTKVKSDILSNYQNKNLKQNKNKEDILNNNSNKNTNLQIINNNSNNIKSKNEKCNHIIVTKKNQNSRYKHPNLDSVNINSNNVKNIYCCITESNRKIKQLSVSHNKSKSGSGSIIKFNIQDNNIFNIKSGNFLKGNNFKKFKSISPTIQRRNYNNSIVKEKKSKSKSQSRSKTKNKSRYNKNELNELNNLIMNGKYNINSSKQKSIKEKMDIILSKNIIALTKKVRKSPSPKIRISPPSLVKKLINSPQNKIRKSIKFNNCGNNNYYSGAHSRKNKNSPSPVSFHISNNNSIYNTNLLVNNNKKLVNRKKIIGNSPKYLNNQNSTEHYDNLGIKNNDKINYQSSSSNKKKNLQNFPYKNRSIFCPSAYNINHNLIKNQKIQNKKIKNVSRKNKNVYKYDDEYNSMNDRKRSLNVNILKGNKKQNNSKNSFIGNMINNNKNIIINDINRKNTIILNNIKINNNTCKRQMTIIQNFSKYKKKGALNIINKNIVKINCRNENVSNNYYEVNKIKNEGNATKKIKSLNINNNIENKTIDEKRRKNEYNHSHPKISDHSNNFYTN